MNQAQKTKILDALLVGKDNTDALEGRVFDDRTRDILAKEIAEIREAIAEVEKMEATE